MAGERVYFVVPFRVRFSPIGMSGWVKGALPVFWHHWSEATDIRRIPLDRRWSILWNWWINRPRTMAVPLEARAVEWWLSRRLRGDHWEWDPSFVAAQRGTKVRDVAGSALGSDALKAPLREFLCPEAFARFLGEDLSQPVNAQSYVPPVSCYHLRLRGLDASRSGWLTTESGRRLEVDWGQVRMHLFRFGDGFLSFEAEIDAPLGDLKSWLGQRCRDPDALRFGYGGAPLIPWSEATEVSYRELVESLLLPAEPYEPDKPDREHWSFRWGDDTELEASSHRIELPLLSRLPALMVARPNEDSPRGATEAVANVSGPLAQIEGGSRGAAADLPLRSLAVFLLALFRHLKVTEVADMFATPRGRRRLESAHYLQYLSYHLALAHDRFKVAAPVFGGSNQLLWRRLEEEWRLREDQERIASAVHVLREDYFRDLSLRLIARVTSTFWFLFRWILVPFIIVKVTLFLVSSMIIAAAGVLTLSLFATVAVLIATHLHGRIKRSEGLEPSPRSRRRTDWVMVAAVAEVGLIAVACLVFPELFGHLIPLAGSFAGLLALITLIAFWTLRKRWRRDTVAQFYLRETVPIVAVVISGLAVLSLIVVLGFLVTEYGTDILKWLPRPWEVVQGTEAVTDGGEGAPPASTDSE